MKSQQLNYCMTRVTFGDTSSPFLSIATLHAKDHQDVYPETVQEIAENMYQCRWLTFWECNWCRSSPSQARNVRIDEVKWIWSHQVGITHDNVCHGKHPSWGNKFESHYHLTLINCRTCLKCWEYPSLEYFEWCLLVPEWWRNLWI